MLAEAGATLGGALRLAAMAAYINLRMEYGVNLRFDHGLALLTGPSGAGGSG